MTTIDLIVLGMLKDQALSAYELQKLVEYRNISKWVKVSTPSIYKKVLQLEEKGLIQSVVVKEGRMPEKAVYSLTEAGQKEFDALMLEISGKPVYLYVDFNAVIVNIHKLTPALRARCLARIANGVRELKAYLEENMNRKIDAPDIPETGLAVLRQQYILVQAIEAWLDSLEKE